MATALLIVDVQRMLVDELPLERRTAFVSTLNSLLGRARAAGVAVVYVRHDGGATELTVGTPEWQIASEIAPRSNEPVVDKRFRDAFRETNLAEVLASVGADHLVVGGMQTEFCVDATIREAERRGYRVTLVEDGHATYAVDGTSEEQIRNQVHRVARNRVAQIVPARELFTGITESSRTAGAQAAVTSGFEASSLSGS
jgi:nicotinamidase-related amidase